MVKPVRGGVIEKRAHDLLPRNATDSPPEITSSSIPHGETSSAALPSLYAKWMDSVLPGGIPSEPNATCDDCAMQPGETKPRGDDALYFSPETKCCTLVPNLPNYLVGQILADEDPDPSAIEGRRTVLARIVSRGAVTPLGLGRTLAFSLHYRHHSDKFGRSRALRCPHYIEEGGRCGVWKFRESTCATWFCKYERGVVGVRFWSALQATLAMVEHELAFWCAKALGLDTEPVRQVYRAGSTNLSTSRGTFATHLLEGLRPERLDRHPLGARDPRVYNELWGAWVDHEVELYQRSAELVSPLSWNEVKEIVGPQLSPMLTKLEVLHGELFSKAVPLQLSHRTAELGLVQIGRRKVQVDAYRPHDPQEIPAQLLELLPEFDGRGTEATLSAIEKGHGVRLEPALVRKLVDFGLLVER